MNETEEIKNRLPIEQVVGGYVPLKKAGRIFKACCPFHNEKTPSFTVSPDRGIFKCFGCGEGGDIFDFVMKIEGLTFPETVRLLAERAGVALEEWKPEGKSAGRSSEVPRDRLVKLNAYTAKLWHTILQQHEKAESARAYLEGRGVKSETQVNFQIGYAPFGTATSTALQKAGFTQKEIGAAGDPTKFQDRITFPIWDITGRVIGFTGRLLELKDDPNRGAGRGPKYWNTPETSLFIKSRAVYALHLAKHAIQEEDLAILAEGQMDVIMLHQAGFANAIASSGTALTPDQLRLISRFSANIAFAYDQDSAGIEATKRGIELALAAELNPYVISIPGGKDPAEALQKDPEAWQQAYIDRAPYMSWLIEQSLSESESLTPQRKKEVVKELLPWLARIPDPVEQREWLRITAAKLQTEEENLLRALSRLQPEKERPRPSQAPSTSPPPPPSSTLTPSQQKAELALALLLSFPETFPQVYDQLGSFRLAGTTPFLEQVLPRISDAPKDASLKEVMGSFPPEEEKEISLYTETVLKPYQETELESKQALGDILIILQRLRSEAKDHEKTRLAKEIKDAQILGDTARLQQLFAELKNLL